MTPTEAAVRRYNARLGLVLFASYSAFYVGFVLINAFRPEQMETIVLWGLNLAIVYGFALIFAALVLALIYGFACRVVGPGRASGGDHPAGGALGSGDRGGVDSEAATGEQR